MRCTTSGGSNEGKTEILRRKCENSPSGPSAAERELSESALVRVRADEIVDYEAQHCGAGMG